MKGKSIDKLIINGLLSGVLAMGLGTATAFASDGDTGAAAGSATPVSATVQQSQVLILPGDFFYFLKTFMEKAEIVLTVDDVQQAKLMTLFTQERIREADVLFAEGKPALAVVTLHKALDDQEQVMANDKEDAEATTNQQLSNHYRSNLEALTYVLEKVKNPRAKTALSLNIEKTKAKLAQMTKPAEQAVAEPATGVEIQVQVTREQKSGIQDVRDEADYNEDADHNDEADHEQHADHHDDGDQGGSGNNSAQKAIREQLKQERKAAHELAKEERKAAHEQAKDHHKK
jgi:colicin import membrane protein